MIYKTGEQVATLTTDKNGQASVDGLYLGDYYVKEISPSAVSYTHLDVYKRQEHMFV